MSRLSFAPPENQIVVDVQAARLDFPTQAGTECSPDALRKVIEEAGYELGKITIDGKPAP